MVWSRLVPASSKECISAHSLDLYAIRFLQISLPKSLWIKHNQVICRRLKKYNFEYSIFLSYRTYCCKVGTIRVILIPVKGKAVWVHHWCFKFKESGNAVDQTPNNGNTQKYLCISQLFEWVPDCNKSLHGYCHGCKSWANSSNVNKPKPSDIVLRLFIRNVHLIS